MRCEDYPCCGHGPAPHGDGGGCPDAQGRFNCVLCNKKLAKGATSSICAKCRKKNDQRGWRDDFGSRDPDSFFYDPYDNGGY